MCSSLGSTVTRRLDEVTEGIEAQLLGLVSHHGMQSRLTSPPMLTVRQRFLFLCYIFSGGYAEDMYILVANQHCSCRATQVLDYI